MAEFDPMKFFALWMFTHDQADALMHEAQMRPVADELAKWKADFAAELSGQTFGLSDVV